MELIQPMGPNRGMTGLEHFKIDARDYNGEKILDKFDLDGKIYKIHLIFKKEFQTTTFKVKIGKRELMESDFMISTGYSWHLNQTNKEGIYNCYNSQIEFKNGDIFKVQQGTNDVWRVLLWVII